MATNLFIFADIKPVSQYMTLHSSYVALRHNKNQSCETQLYNNSKNNIANKRTKISSFHNNQNERIIIHYCKQLQKFKTTLSKTSQMWKLEVCMWKREFLHRWAYFRRWPEHLEESLPTTQSAEGGKRKRDMHDVCKYNHLSERFLIVMAGFSAYSAYCQL